MHPRPVGDHGHSAVIQGQNPRDGPRGTGESPSDSRLGVPGPARATLPAAAPPQPGRPEAPGAWRRSSRSARPSAGAGAPPCAPAAVAWRQSPGAAMIWRGKGAQQLLHRLDLGFSFWSSGCPGTPEVTGQLQRRAPVEFQRGQFGGSLCLECAQGAAPSGGSGAAGDPSPSHSVSGP